MSELKKHHAEDFLASDKTKVARSYSVTSSAQSLMGANPNTQNQWTSYGVQPQAWPPVTQAQGQHWHAGHTHQAAYGAYTGYGVNHANSQLPTSVPQTTAYGDPPAYPLQPAPPQQNYAQPVAVVQLQFLMPIRGDITELTRIRWATDFASCNVFFIFILYVTQN